MIKYTETKKVIETTEVEYIVCDKCNLKSERSDAFPAGTFPAITRVEVFFGYGSKFDTEIWELDLCDDCAKKIFEPERLYS